MNRYKQIIDDAEVEIERKRRHAATWSHVWDDPYTYQDYEDTEFNKQGGIDRDSSRLKFRKFLKVSGFQQYEMVALLRMYNRAIAIHAKVAHIDFKIAPDNVVRLPRQLIHSTERQCAICADKTRSGIHALCDGCHERFTIKQKYFPLSFEEVTTAIWRADTRHHAKVRKLNAA